MENRLPLRDTRPLSSLAPSDTDYDEDYPYSRSEDSVRFATDNIQPIQENVFATPPGSPRPSNVFATPVHSRSPSPIDLDRGDSGESTFAPSVYSLRRDSSFSSSRRSSSPIRVANGGYFPHHRASSSLAPSIISNSSAHASGSGLHRSNTVATNTTNSTNSSTLYSIPSQLSQFSSPPSPLPSIAPVRPRFDYGGHQQSIYPLSVHSNSDIGEHDHDPFGDGFEIPVGDGFAPHHQRQPPSIASTEPPPYSMYPDQPPLKPEERGIVADVQSNPDSGFSAGEDRRDSRVVILSPVGGTGAGQARGGNGGGPDNLDDGSGAAKEWKEKRWLGVKARIILLGLGMGLMLLLAVGLGVGLGMGLKKSSDSIPSISSFTTTIAEVPPSSEETGPPISDPNDTFPNITTGMAVLTPLILMGISSDCLIKPQDPFSPGFFNIGSDLLWSCQNSPDKPLVWKFDPFPQPPGANMDNFPSHPDFLRGAEYEDGDWGGYMLSSLEGITKFDGDWDMVIKDGSGQEEHSDGPGWRDGTQNPPFWHIPLAYYNTTSTPTNNKLLKLRSNNNSTPVGKFANYRFGILYNKTVVLKQSAIDQTLAVLGNTGGFPKFANGTALGEGEIVWKCVWEKTLLDVEISINQPSLAQSPTVFAGDRGPPGHGDGDDGLGDGPGGGQGSDGFSQDRSGTSSGSSPGDPQGPPGGPPPQSSFYTGDGGQFKPPVTTLTIPTPTGLNTSIDGTDGADESSDIPIAGVTERGESTLPYPLKITIAETRPSPNQLRRILGMDLTDADPSGLSRLGDIKCTRMVVTPRGGLRELIDANGGGLVILREPVPPRQKRDSTPGGCSCRWVS